MSVYQRESLFKGQNRELLILQYITVPSRKWCTNPSIALTYVVLKMWRSAATGSRGENQKGGNQFHYSNQKG